jgi:hypothetical protein
MEKKLIGGHVEVMYIFSYGNKLNVVRDVNSIEEAERADLLINLWEELYENDKIVRERWTVYECRNANLCHIAELVDKLWRDNATWREIKEALTRQI